MIDHCITLSHRIEEDKIYRVYTTDALKVISENTAHIGGGNEITVRYYDMIHPPKIEERTEKEVIDDIRRKISNL